MKFDHSLTMTSGIDHSIELCMMQALACLIQACLACGLLDWLTTQVNELIAQFTC